jgi:hypothetical protein
MLPVIVCAGMCCPNKHLLLNSHFPMQVHQRNDVCCEHDFWIQRAPWPCETLAFAASTSKRTSKCKSRISRPSSANNRKSLFGHTLGSVPFRKVRQAPFPFLAQNNTSCLGLSIFLIARLSFGIARAFLFISAKTFLPLHPHFFPFKVKRHLIRSVQHFRCQLFLQYVYF